MADDAPDSGAVVTFARAADFDVEAIKQAAYRFSDQVSVEIKVNETEYKCVLRKLATASKIPQEITDEFRNEVLDHDLRIKIAVETESYRNLILSLAFSKTPLGQ